jgi:hypothetical protein
MAWSQHVGTFWPSTGLHLLTVLLLVVALSFFIHASVRYADNERPAYVIVRDPSSLDL